MENIIKAILPVQIKHALRNITSYFQEINFKPYITKQNIEGVSFDFYIADCMGSKWYAQRTSWPEMRFIRDRLIKKGDVIFEIGAHHGFTTILMSNWVGEKGKIIAFEPLQKNYKTLLKNIELNNISNVILKNKAVGSKIGKIRMNKFSNSCVSKGFGSEVNMTCLDNFYLLNPSLIKIDVEGYEIEVLKGAEKVLSRRPKIAIEFHTKQVKYYNSTVEDFFKLIDVGIYEFWLKGEHDSEPKPFYFKEAITGNSNLFAIPKLK